MLRRVILKKKKRRFEEAYCRNLQGVLDDEEDGITLRRNVGKYFINT